MNQLRRARYVFVFLVMAGLLGYFVWPREPVWQGRQLSAWLEDLHEQHVWANVSEHQSWESKQKAATSAVRNIGPRAVPWLMRWMRASPQTVQFRDRVQALLDKQSVFEVQLPNRRDYSEKVVAGFQALGAAALPAVPELGKLLLEPAYCLQAAACLQALGPASFPAVVPALTNAHAMVQGAAWSYLVEFGPQIGPPALPALLNALTNPACQFQSEALMALGEMGPLARSSLPWLEAAMRDLGNPLAGGAMRVMAELSDDPARYIPFFSERLKNPSVAQDAAFALAQVGPEAMSPLIQALTNSNAVIHQAALVALGESKEHSMVMRPLKYRFFARNGRFNSRCLTRKMRSLNKQSEVEALSVSSRAAEHLDHPNPAVRRQIVDLLIRYGHYSALGLSRAAEDQDEQVRTAAQQALGALDLEVKEGAIVRGPKEKRQIAVVFTGHEYAEGGQVILEELGRHNAQASFFLTGVFLANNSFQPFIERLYNEGHYLGLHSDQHLLYCPWQGPKKTLVTRSQFDSDFTANLNKLQFLGTFTDLHPRYFVPPYEHYNRDIVEWACAFFSITINLTQGTRSAADYTGEADANFVSSQVILDSIMDRERQDAHGLNGFILLFHVGSGPGRADKFHHRFGELLERLTAKGYQFVAVDELFDPQAAAERRDWQKEHSLRFGELMRRNAATEAFRKRYGLDR